MKATLPYPPSTNVYWRVFRGRAVLSAEAKKYKATVKVLLAKHTILSGPVALTAHVYRPQKSGDLDNRLKVLGDALNGVIWLDDKQVVEIHAYRHDDKTRPRVEVEVIALAEDVPSAPSPAEVVEGCVTAGCKSEARAGGLHCERHDVKNRLKRSPKVQSAHRAAKKVAEAMPKKRTCVVCLEPVNDAGYACAEHDPAGISPARLSVDLTAVMRDMVDNGEAVVRVTKDGVFPVNLRHSRGVEGELQPLKAARAADCRCGHSELRHVWTSCGRRQCVEECPCCLFAESQPLKVKP